MPTTTATPSTPDGNDSTVRGARPNLGRVPPDQSESAIYTSKLSITTSGVAPE